MNEEEEEDMEICQKRIRSENKQRQVRGKGRKCCGEVDQKWSKAVDHIWSEIVDHKWSRKEDHKWT